MVGYGISKSVNNSRAKLDSVTLANIEALADGESFTFNGQEWNDNHYWYNHIGGKWKPVEVNCTGTTSIGFDSIYYSESFDGKMVECAYGDGNCWNGTSCTPV